MAHFLGIAAVWLVWTTAEIFLTMPKWAWYGVAIALGLGWELLVRPLTWWYGFGIGGATAVLMVITDLALVVTDAAKLSALRQGRGR